VEEKQLVDAAIASGIKLAVCSSNSQKNVELVVNSLGVFFFLIWHFGQWNETNMCAARATCIPGSSRASPFGQSAFSAFSISLSTYLSPSLGR
jgi:hypothetical protein